MEMEYRIRKKTARLEVDVQGDHDFVVEQFDRLWDEESSATPKESGTGLGGLGEGGAQSLVEYVNAVNADAHTETTLAIAGYMFQHQGQREFTMKDIEEGFREIMRPPPGNTSQTIRNVIRQGHMMKAGKKDGLTAYSITRSGLDALQTGFGNKK